MRDDLRSKIRSAGSAPLIRVTLHNGFEQYVQEVRTFDGDKPTVVLRFAQGSLEVDAREIKSIDPVDGNVTTASLRDAEGGTPVFSSARVPITLAGEERVAQIPEGFEKSPAAGARELLSYRRRADQAAIRVSSSPSQSRLWESTRAIAKHHKSLYQDYRKTGERFTTIHGHPSWSVTFIHRSSSLQWEECQLFIDDGKRVLVTSVTIPTTAKDRAATIAASLGRSMMSKQAAP